QVVTPTGVAVVVLFGLEVDRRQVLPFVVVHTFGGHGCPNRRSTSSAAVCDRFFGFRRFTNDWASSYRRRTREKSSAATDGPTPRLGSSGSTSAISRSRSPLLCESLGSQQIRQSSQPMAGPTDSQ